MENTLENKAKFFAQYWFQLVQRYGNDHNVKQVNAFIEESLLDGDYLLLTPVSAITDKDAIHIAKLAYVKLEEYFLEMGKHIASLIEKDAHMGSISFQETLSIMSYLIGQGYYIGDGKEIQYGWVRLKSEIWK